MIIFLAAILDAPQQLYESAELDGAGPFQRMRWVTLPTISPVILFSGRDQRDRRDAVLHAGIRRREHRLRPGVTGRRPDRQQPRLPRGLDALLSRAAVPARLQFFNMGYASALSVLLLIVAFTVTVLIIRNSRAGFTTRER
jgi:multiple sugar transport system permease protein